MFRNIDLRSKRRAKGYRKPAAPPITIHQDAIIEHVSRHLAPPELRLHEEGSEIVSVDVHVVPPAPSRDFWFLFTTGMSARPMARPPGAPGARHAELSILLPVDWQFHEGSWRQERWYWPIRELRMAAVLPHRCRAAFDDGQTISSSITDGATRFLAPKTRLSSLLITRSPEVPRALDTIQSGTTTIELFTLIPLYPEELEHKFAHGPASLREAMRAAGISDVVDPARRSAVATSNEAN